MIIKRLEIENFKALRSVALDLDARANVFAGVNGAGKSTLIQAVQLMFGRYVFAMRFGRPSGRGPMLKELRIGADRVHLAIAAEHEGSRFTWKIDRAFKGLHSRKTDQDLSELRAFIATQLEKLDAPETANVPIFTTYPVGRAVLEIPLHVRTKESYSQALAFQATALNTARPFRTFFTWFRNREDYENERRLEDPDYRDPQIAAVRNAVEHLMPGFTDLRVRRRPLRMVASKEGVEFEIDTLSDGEKGLLAMAGDLARRLSLANPNRARPDEGDGIVLIDELELHLHPAWQRNAVHGLLKAFPNIQFIFTTHSPQVLSELRPEQTFLLKEGVAISASRSYGMDSTHVLRELMGDPGRPLVVEKEINEIYQGLEVGDVESSERRLQGLESTMGGDDPVLTVARARIRRGKVLRDRAVHR